MKLPKNYYYDPKKKLYKCRFTVNGQRYTVYGHTQTECEKRKSEKTDSIRNRMNLDNQRITLEKYYSMWIVEQAKEVKEQTIYNYEKSWFYISKYIGKMKIVDIEKAHVLHMQNKVVAESTTDNANRVVRLCKQILNSAVIDRIIISNPCIGIKNLKSAKPKAVDTNHRALTEEETRLFLQYAGESQHNNLFLFLLSTGVRIGEATALTWFDINFDKAEININKTVARVEDGFIISNSAKTESSNRMIPITKDLERILKDQFEQNQILFGSKCIYVFPNNRGGFANYNGVNNSIRAIIKNINKDSPFIFPHFTAHAFRDTFATRCIEQGMQPQTLKTILGHSSLKMTMDLYAHVMPNTKHEELSKIRFVV